MTDALDELTARVEVGGGEVGEGLGLRAGIAEDDGFDARQGGDEFGTGAERQEGAGRVEEADRAGREGLETLDVRGHDGVKVAED